MDFQFDFEAQIEEDERAKRAEQEARHSQQQQQAVNNVETTKRPRRYSGGESSEVSHRPTKRPRTTHQVVCRHWLRGTCIKGDECDFLHIIDPSRMPPCRHFRKHGRCLEFEQGSCQLRHDREDVGGADDVASSLPPTTADSNPVSPQPELRKNGAACLQYLFGYCLMGPFCSQRHIKLAPDQRPNFPLPDWYISLMVLNRAEIEFTEIEQHVARENARNWRIFAASLTEDQKATEYASRTLEELLPPIPWSCPVPPPLRSQDLAVRVFVIKSAKIENILTSIQKGIWATGKANITKFEQAFRTCHHVLFVMSANESGGFQGYARMATLSDPSLYPRVWGSFSSKLSPNFRLQWLKQCKVDFEQLASYTNPWNENKPLKKSRDGQELPLEVSEAVFLRLDMAENEDLLAGTPLARQPRINHQTFFELNESERRSVETRLGLRT